MVKALDSSTNQSTKELGEKSLDYMRKQYMENNMSSHTSNINLKPYNHRYKKGFIISSGDDEVAIYNEFGTGIVGEGTNPLADSAGYEYNVNSVYKGMVPKGAISQYAKSNKMSNKDAREELITITTENTWWYYKNGSWRHTEGMSGKNMYSSLVEELKENAIKDIGVSVSQTIGSYGGKK